jgi:hypothetical protein
VGDNHRVAQQDDRKPTLDEILEGAASLSDAKRRAFAEWEATALRSERQMAFSAVLDAARAAGREREIVASIDDAYQAAARSAGMNGRVSYFDDDLGRRPRESWEAAAEQAATAAAVAVAGELIPPEMAAFLLEPWRRFAGAG